VRALAWLMTGVLLFAAAVQWNDPDPLLWIAFYGLAAAASLGAALARVGRAWRALELVAVGVSAVVVARLAPSLAGARLEAVTSFQMRSSDDELVRELVGAAIALVWTGTLAVHRWRRDAAPGGA
jgi:hypothetical protein